MNRIITINIGGIAIQIEEDAYEVLQKYLKKIKGHFANTPNGSEIIEDIEARIAEMLFEKLEMKPSINTEDINHVIEVMGNPLEFEEDEDVDDPEMGYKRTKKSLFRDPDKGILGGVSAGLSHYLGVDVVIIRAIWLILLFMFGTGVLLYLILWLIIPKADSTADRIKMMGETPNINNIKNTIRDEANNAYQNIKDSGVGDRVKSLFERIGDLLFSILGGLGKTVVAVLSILLFIVFVVLVSHLFLGDFVFNYEVHWLGRESLGQLYNYGFMFWLTLSSFYLLFLIPIARILVGLLQFTFGSKISKESKSVMRSGFRYLFLFSLTVFILCAAYTYSWFAHSETRVDDIKIEQTDTIYITKINENQFAKESTYRLKERVRLDIKYTSDDEWNLKLESSAKGRDEEEAVELLSEITQIHDVSGSKLGLMDRVYIPKTSSYRGQELRYTLMVPENKVIILNENMYSIVRRAQSIEGFRLKQMVGNSLKMTPQGLKCLTCNGKNMQAYGKHTLSDDFNQISINEWIKTTITYGEHNTVHLEGKKSVLKEIDTEIKNGKLNIYSHDKDYVWDHFRDDVEVFITCSDLKSLEANGASIISLEDFKNLNDLDVELNGASELKTRNINVNSLRVEVNGASKVELKGDGDNLEIETNGASAIEAYRFNAKNVTLDIAGAATCKIYASNSLKGSAKGVSKIRYKGSAQSEVDIDGFASVKRSH